MLNTHICKMTAKKITCRKCVHLINIQQAKTLKRLLVDGEMKSSTIYFDSYDLTSHMCVCVLDFTAMSHRGFTELLSGHGSNFTSN